MNNDGEAYGLIRMRWLWYALSRLFASICSRVLYIGTPFWWNLIFDRPYLPVQRTKNRFTKFGTVLLISWHEVRNIWQTTILTIPHFTTKKFVITTLVWIGGQQQNFFVIPFIHIYNVKIFSHIFINVLLHLKPLDIQTSPGESKNWFHYTIAEGAFSPCWVFSSNGCMYKAYPERLLRCDWTTFVWLVSVACSDHEPDVAPL